MTINIELKKGGHRSPEEGLCLLEAAAFVAGESHSDHPECVDPVLGAFGRALNDGMTDDERQLLVPLIEKLVGTKADHTLSLRRAMLLCDGAVRQILPMSFDALGLAEEASKLRALEPVTSESAAWSAESAANAANAARSAARSAANAARSAANAANAARSAANAARSAANAAWSAAWSAESAAWSAAWSAESAARRPVIEAAVALFNAAIDLKAVP